MASVTAAQVTIYEDSGVTLMARVVGNDAANVAQADVSTCKRKVYRDGTIVGTETTLTVADVVFDALQTDARWTVDSTGFNFADAIGSTVFPTGDALYIVEYKFTPASGADYHAVWEVHTRNLYGS